jgi:hypothetical protein
MRDALVPLAVVALLLATAAAPVGGVPDARLTVSEVTVSPETPVPEAPVTADVTVQLSAGSTSAVDLQELFLVGEDGEQRGTATNVGSLSPGGSVAVPLTTSFDEPGRKDLQVVVVGENESGGEVRITRPLTVVVEQASPQVSIDAGRAVAGVESAVGVDVANPTTAPIRNVDVTVRGAGDVERRSLATLGAGGSETLNVSLRPSSAGNQSVTATVEYTTARGTRATQAANATVQVAPLREDVGLRVDRVDRQPAASAGGDIGSQIGSLIGGGAGATATQQQGGEGASENAVSVAVTNFGNAPVRDAVLIARANGTTVARYSVGALAPGASTSVPVDLASVDDGPVRFVANYTLAGRAATVETTYGFSPGTAEVTVTGVNLTRTGDGTLSITGNAGNAGTAEVSGLVVAVGSNEHVEPAYPQRDYFVGTVDGSEFAPFELTAAVDADNASAIPLQVRYSVDGEQRVETVELPVGEPVQSEPARQGLPVGLIGGVLIVLGAALAIVAATVRFR